MSERAAEIVSHPRFSHAARQPASQRVIEPTNEQRASERGLRCGEAGGSEMQRAVIVVMVVVVVEKQKITDTNVTI